MCLALKRFCLVSIEKWRRHRKVLFKLDFGQCSRVLGYSVSPLKDVKNIRTLLSVYTNYYTLAANVEHKHTCDILHEIRTLINFLKG